MKADTEIISLEELKRLLSRYEACYPGGLYFRGESRNYPSMMPSVERNPEFLVHEPELYQESVSTHQLSGDIITNLARLQHYGVPTRLIDLTVDVRYALYFACESNDDEPGYVFMYIPKQTAKDKDSPEVRALSLLASKSVNSLEELVCKYKENFQEEVTAGQMISLCLAPTFIRYDESLHSDNERMKLQHGAFVICGSNVERLPKRDIIGLDDIPAARVFLIAPEHKAAIRQELKTSGVEQHAVYPELSETAKALREKYGSKQQPLFQPSDYEIKEEDVRQKGHFNDMKLTIIIKRHLSIDVIKMIIREVCRNYHSKVAVIYSFVALSNEDYITKNWFLRGEWIRPGFSFGAIKPLKIVDEKGFSWDFSGSARIQYEWNEERSFGDDKQQLRRYLATYHRIKEEISEGYGFLKSLEKGMIVERPRMPITAKAILFDFKFSRNKALDDFFTMMDGIFGTAHNIYMEIAKDYSGLTGYELKRAMIPIEIYMNTYENEKQLIDSDEAKWIREIGITEEEIENTDPVKGDEYPIPAYKHKIPVNDNPIEVIFKVLGERTDNGRIKVVGKTNLHDGAKLMVQLDGKATDHVVTKMGTFYCILGAEGSCMEGETHHVSVILPIPTTQDIEFLKWAGMEYENLSGDVMTYNFSPSAKYEADFMI